MPNAGTPNRITDIRSLFERVAPSMAELDRFMQEQVGQFEPEIRTMAAYCLESSGKRLRPTLVFIAGWPGDGSVNPELVRAAGVVEMVHLATLVHDDIMDQAEIRRNRRTAAREFGADAAVLLGDALFAQALHIAAQFPTTEVCRRVSASTRRVCTGEITQTLRRRELNVSREDYRRMIDLKTAELFCVSCYLGAMLAGHGLEFAGAAEKFGRHLGIAYQIYDDLADFFGDETKIGKTLGTDLATGKMTLPLMLLMERATPAERVALAESFRAGRPIALTISRQRMAELDIATAVVEAIEADLQQADNLLQPYASVPPATLLFQLTDLVRSQVANLMAGARH